MLYLDTTNARLFLKLKPFNSFLYCFIEISSEDRWSYTKIGMHWINERLKSGRLKEVSIDDEMSDSKYRRRIFKAVFSIFKGWE